MTLREAAARLLNRRVVVTTTTNAEVTGTLKVVGDDFIDVEYEINRLTLIPLSPVATVKEQ